MVRSPRLLSVGALVLASAVAVAGCSSHKSTTAATTTVPSSSTTTLPAVPVAANTPYCQLARQFATSVTLALPNDPQVALAQFDALAPQLLAEAPPSIKGDAQAAVAAVRQVEPALKAAGDDPGKLTAAQLAPVESPAFTDDVNAINAYDLDSCGITPPTT
jgi:ABC-type glycerol-3-phosphate transport system substrate-binding protein